MARRVLRSLWIACGIAALTLCGGLLSSAQADQSCFVHGHPNVGLFNNYYVAPQCGGTGAQLYVSPLPVPEYVGHTYITYEPFRPHEMLYRHKRVYWQRHQGESITRTKVRWLW